MKKEISVFIVLLAALAFSYKGMAHDEPAPVDVSKTYSKYSLSVSTGGMSKDPRSCGLTQSQITDNAVAKMMKRTIPYDVVCTIIYIMGK